MMYVLLAIAAVSFIIIVVMVVRKFPQLSNIDIDNLPQEKEARKKKEIINRRIQAEGTQIFQKLLSRFKPVQKLWGLFQLKFRIYVGKIERLWHHEERSRKKQREKTQPVEDKELKLQSILQEASTYVQASNLEKAEALFISAISLSPKSIEAYHGLADTYYAKGSLEEAKETFQFLLKLKPDDDKALGRLAEIAEVQGNVEQAVEYLQQAVVLNDAVSSRFHHLAELLIKMKEPESAKEAILSAVELEPKNPKYLDLLIEIGILCSDKELAERGISELRLVNPKNQKLQIFQDRLKELAS